MPARTCEACKNGVRKSKRQIVPARQYTTNRSNISTGPILKRTQLPLQILRTYRRTFGRTPGFRFNRATLLAVFSITALVAVACSGSGRGSGGDFDITTYQSGGVLEGRETSLQAVLDQGKPVVLNFWAGQCPPCRAEMPALDGAWQEFQDEIVMLGIDVGPFFGLGSYDSGVALLRELQVTYPAGNTGNRSFLQDFNLTGLPGTFFMLPDGTINDNFPGAISSGRLQRRINELIDAHKEQQAS